MGADAGAPQISRCNPPLLQRSIAADGAFDGVAREREPSRISRGGACHRRRPIRLSNLYGVRRAKDTSDRQRALHDPGRRCASGLRRYCLDASVERRYAYPAKNDWGRGFPKQPGVRTAERAGLLRLRKSLPRYVERLSRPRRTVRVVANGGYVAAAGVRTGQAALNRETSAPRQRPSYVRVDWRPRVVPLCRCRGQTGDSDDETLFHTGGSPFHQGSPPSGRQRESG
jgi:hypothetical protein